MIFARLLGGLGSRGWLAITILTVFVAGTGVLNLALPSDHALHVPTYIVSLFGKYLCFALLALSIDLVWGFCGVLSLGHGAFFALGGYTMGMYLMRLRPSGASGLHGFPELAGASLVLVRL